jgi:hypothetical protein
MLPRVKNWIQGSRRKSGERWEADRGRLSERERHDLDVHEPARHRRQIDLDDAEYGPKAFDEERRGTTVY